MFPVLHQGEDSPQKLLLVCTGRLLELANGKLITVAHSPQRSHSLKPEKGHFKAARGGPNYVGSRNALWRSGLVVPGLLLPITFSKSHGPVQNSIHGRHVNTRPRCIVGAGKGACPPLCSYHSETFPSEYIPEYGLNIHSIFWTKVRFCKSSLFLLIVVTSDRLSLVILLVFSFVCVLEVYNYSKGEGFGFGSERLLPVGAGQSVVNCKLRPQFLDPPPAGLDRVWVG